MGSIGSIARSTKNETANRGARYNPQNQRLLPIAFGCVQACTTARKEMMLTNTVIAKLPFAVKKNYRYTFSVAKSPDLLLGLKM